MSTKVDATIEATLKQMIPAQDSEHPQVDCTTARSVAEMTFGAIQPRKCPEDFRELRRHFEEGVAEEVMADTPSGY